MEKAYQKEVISVAKSQVGYLEKTSNNNLDDFKNNAGFGNYTKYARDYADFAGINLQAQSWCAMFINWVFVKAYGKDIAKVLLGGFDAYTPTSAQRFKNMKQWFEKDPKIGDVIYFKNIERICHIGLVMNVNNNTVYTVEGNTSVGSDVIPNGGGVYEKQYILNNTRIAGYGRPKYDVEPEKNVAILTPTSLKFNNTDWTKRLQKILNVSVDGIAGEKTLAATKTVKLESSGDITKLVQEKLTAIGYDTKGVDGKAGVNTVTAIKNYQSKELGIKNPDGEFTAQGASWKALLGIK